MKSKNKHAISLIVLVVTILVLAILAAAVIISLSNSNIMSQASKTVFKSDMANFKEAYEMYVIGKFADDADYDRSTLNVTYANNKEVFEDIFGENVSDKYKEGLKIVNGKLVYVTEDETEKDILEELGIASSATVTPSTPTEPDTPVTPNTPADVISKDTTGTTTSPYLGYYVKIGDEYGIIFADLLYGGEGTWSSTNDSTYKYDPVAGEKLKDYTVSSEKITPSDSKFGENYVLEVTGDSSGKQDRFYVMALSDVNTGTYYCWYDAAYDSGINNANSQVTSTDFGTGKANTATMITAWNKGTGEGGYGAKDDNSTYKDMWGVIQDKVDKGWFVPSKDEWSAFAVYLKGREPALTTSNYSSTYGLKDEYWSSSLNSFAGVTFAAGRLYFPNGCVFNSNMDLCGYVRLAATF